MLSKGSRWLRKNRKAHRPAPCGTHSARPQLEQLEDRVAPANTTCTFTPGTGGGPQPPTNLWSDDRNWDVMPDGSGTDTVIVAPPARGFTTGVQDVSANIAGLGLDGGGSLTVNNPLTVGSAGTTGTGFLDINSQLETDNVAFDGGTTIEDGGELDITGGGSNAFGPISDTKVIGSLLAPNSPSISMLGTGTLSGSMGAGTGGDCTITFGLGSGWAQVGNGSFLVGHYVINGGFAVDGTFNPDSLDITLNDDGGTTAGSITGTGSMTLGRAFTWDGGLIGLGGGFTINSSATFTATTGEAKELGGLGLTNSNLSTDLGGAGDLLIDADATLTNASGIVTVSLPEIDGPGTFENDAILKATTPGPTTIRSSFTSTAGGSEIQVDDGDTLTLEGDTGAGGTFLLGGVVQLTGELDVAGTYTAADGPSQDAGAGTLVIVGTLELPSGVTATIGGDAEVIGGGSITGAGQVTVSTGKFTLDVGSTTAIGSYWQQGTGTLAIEASSATAFATLAVSGQAQQSGTLELDPVGGYVPQTGDALAVLTDGSLSGQFDTPPPGWTMSYGTTITATKN